MLTVVDIEYIRKKFFVEHWSIRRISRQLHVSRQSIRKAIKSAEPWQYTLKDRKPCPVMDPYREIIMGWLKADQNQWTKQRHSAKRIYDRLCKMKIRGASMPVHLFCLRLRHSGVPLPRLRAPPRAPWGF